MRVKTEVKSLSATKSKSGSRDFIKYDIDVSLDEIETSENQSKLEYSLVFVSIPRNIRISTEGLAVIDGKESERQEVMEQELNGIPKILQMIYDELFPILFMMTKSMNIPAPSIMLSRLSTTDSTQEETSEANPAKIAEPKDITEKTQETKTSEIETPEEKTNLKEQNPEEMPLEELRSLYAKLDSEYSSNPSEDLQSEMDKIGQIIHKREESTIDSKI